MWHQQCHLTAQTQQSLMRAWSRKQLHILCSSPQRLRALSCRSFGTDLPCGLQEADRDGTEAATGTTGVSTAHHGKVSQQAAAEEGHAHVQRSAEEGMQPAKAATQPDVPAGSGGGSLLASLRQAAGSLLTKLRSGASEASPVHYEVSTSWMRTIRLSDGHAGQSRLASAMHVPACMLYELHALRNP